MKISRVVYFLEKVMEANGDIEIQSITGFWVRRIPATGERVVVCAVGDAQSIEDIIRGAPCPTSDITPSPRPAK